MVPHFTSGINLTHLHLYLSPAGGVDYLDPILLLESQFLLAGYFGINPFSFGLLVFIYTSLFWFGISTFGFLDWQTVILESPV